MVDEIKPEPWSEVNTPVFVLASLFTGIICYLGNSGDRWIPVLDGANLLFHEAGHPLFGIFSERLGVYGGTLGQLVFPVGCAFYFWRKRQSASFFISVVWIMQNLWNIARYLADARAQALPLVGNGDRFHDWTEILGRWNALPSDVLLADRLSWLAGAGVLWVWFWFYTQWRERRGIRRVAF